MCPAHTDHGTCDVCNNVGAMSVTMSVAKSSTSFAGGKGGNVSSVGWQVTLCDPISHASSRSAVATLRTAIPFLLYFSIGYIHAMHVIRPNNVRENVMMRCTAQHLGWRKAGRTKTATVGSAVRGWPLHGTISSLPATTSSTPKIAFTIRSAASTLER